MNVRHWKTNAAICLLVFSTLPAYARDFSALRQRWQPEAAAQNNVQNENPRSPGDKAETQKIAGLDVAIWRPSINDKMSGKAPLIVFSHGFSGRNTQSLFLMRALAGHGYLVIAPNHRDAGALLHGLKPQIDFKEPEKWSDRTYADRRDDIGKLIDALHRDPSWNDCIDWNALGLCGHSLGGYTVLGLAGAWPSWRLNGVKAVLALSPYAAPYAISGDLNGINLPVMYQGGSRDFGLTPTLKKVDGIFDKTSKPAYFVDFSQAGHFAWTNFNHNKSQEELINYYSLAFFDKHLKSAATAEPIVEKDGVIELRCK